MIETGVGSIFDCDVEALVNPVNCMGVSGRGLALEFSKRYPRDQRIYEDACHARDLSPGNVLMHLKLFTQADPIIVYFPTKDHWRDPSNISWIAGGLSKLVSQVESFHIKSIAIPALGCGLGGLKWSEVRPMIEAAFAELPDVRVVIFDPHE